MRGDLRNSARIWGVVALFLVVWVTSQFLVGPSETFTPATKSASQLDTSKILATGLASVDQAVSMLTAVQLSVFIVVGFVLREKLTTGQRPTLEQIMAGAVFLGCAFASITLGYGARIQAIGVVDGAVDQTYAGFGAVETTVVRQALFVVVLAISAVYLVVVALFDANRTRTYSRNSLAGHTSGPHANSRARGHRDPGRFGSRKRKPVMRTRTFILALAMLPLGTFPALATSCRLKDLARNLRACLTSSS